MKYFFNSIGTLVENKPTTSPFSFYGTALSATEINVGRDIQVATPDKDADLFKDVTTGVTTSGFETDFTSGYSWTSEIQHHTDVVPVTVTGSNDVLNVTGSGRVLFFITGFAGTVYTNSNFGVNVFIDGVQIYSTGIHGTGLAQPLSVVGELVKPTANRAGYINYSNLKFNESL